MSRVAEATFIRVAIAVPWHGRGTSNISAPGRCENCSELDAVDSDEDDDGNMMASLQGFLLKIDV